MGQKKKWAAFVGAEPKFGGGGGVGGGRGRKQEREGGRRVKGAEGRGAAILLMVNISIETNCWCRSGLIWADSAVASIVLFLLWREGGGWGG